VLICPWHRRDAPNQAERLGVPIYVPPPDQGDPNPVEGDVFSAGERLPVGVADRTALVRALSDARSLLMGRIDRRSPAR
jgi:hypothetical protein